jgi:MFS family permease
LDNWVDKLDLLCLPKSEIGLLGSSLFVGIICTVIWVPRLSDIKGRRNIMIISLILHLSAYILLYFTKSLKVACICIMAIGSTFAGKRVVAYNYILEICPKHYNQTLINFVYFSESFCIFFQANYYQNISKDWRYLQILGIVMTLIALIYEFIFFYESP